MNQRKKWAVSALVLTALTLVLLGAFTAVVDPVFHYHKPLDSLSYYLFDERYQNDGIVRHFEYDAIITGTSMTENFRPSELDALFGVNTIKVSFSGASYKEIGDNLRRAVEANENIKMVVLGLDGSTLMEQPDHMRTDADFPDYLYDENPFNDVSYLLNKQILLRYTMRMLQQTYYGSGTTSFDEYAYWWHQMDSGAEAVLSQYARKETASPERGMDAQTEQMVRENIRKNVVSIAQENPDITFYCFFPPYSVVFWDYASRAGRLERHMEAFRIASEELLSCENIRLYSYFEEQEWVADLNYYCDIYHYSDEINSRILQSMHRDTNRLTRGNYDSYWDDMTAVYAGFDYDAFLRENGWEG